MASHKKLTCFFFFCQSGLRLRDRHDSNQNVDDNLRHCTKTHETTQPQSVQHTRPFLPYLGIKDRLFTKLREIEK